jgi:hypothetical protein
MITKRIKPVVAYGSMGRVEATSYTVRSMEDNLFDTVSFKHELLTESGLFACSASHTFKYTSDAESKYTGLDDSGTMTCTWDASAEGAYIIVAQALGFEFEPTADATKESFFEG